MFRTCLTVKMRNTNAKLGLVAVVICLILANKVFATTYGCEINYASFAQLRLYINNPAKKISYRFVVPPSLNGKTLYGVYIYSTDGKGSIPICRVGLQADIDGLPSGSWLSTGQVPVTTTFLPAGRGTFEPIQLPGYTLSAGTAYHLVICYESGVANSQNYVAFAYAAGHDKADMSVLTDYGNGWVMHKNADPIFALNFGQGQFYGQVYTNCTDQLIYGSGSNSGFGQQFVATNTAIIKRISFLMRLAGSPTASCRIVIKDVQSGEVLVDEVFCTPADFPRSSSRFSNCYWVGHDLTSPVTLTAGRTYRIWLYEDGYGGDAYNCYRIRCFSTTSETLSPLTWGGSTSCSIAITGWGNLTHLPRADTPFRLNTASLEINYRHLTCVTPTSATIVVSTNRTSNVTVEYGETNQYGMTANSSNLSRHEIVLTRLQAGKNYHYRLTCIDSSNPNNSIITEDSEFRIPLPDDTITVDVIGDLQQCSNSYAIGQVIGRRGDILLTAGDNTELAQFIPGVNPTKEEAKFEWQLFLGLLNPSSWSPALYLTTGNHDNVSATTCAQAWQEELTLPTNGASEMYYSFDYGPAHFVVLDSASIDRTISSQQLDWLKQDLGSTNKPWKIAVIHYLIKGMSPLEEIHNWWVLKNADTLHQIFTQYGVRLVLQGHRHVYNRYVKDGIFYVINSTMSYDLSYAPFGWETPYSGVEELENIDGESGTIPAYINFAGSTRLEISPEQLTVSFIDGADRVLDKFSLAPSNFDLISPANEATVSSATPTFSWAPSIDDASGLVEYELWIDNQLCVDNIPPQWTYCIPFSPLSDGAHTWCVIARNRAGLSRLSETFTVNVNVGSEPDITPPTNPVNVIVYSSSDREEILQSNHWYSFQTPLIIWNGATDDSSGVDGYYVYFGTNPNAEPVFSGTYCRVNWYAPTTLSLDGYYYLRIRTVDNRGNFSPDVFEGFVYWLDATSPTQPGIPLTITPTLDPTPVWQWAPSVDNASGLAGYRIDVVVEKSGYFRVCNLWLGNTTIWEQTVSLEPGNYMCRVQAIDNVGRASLYSEWGKVLILPVNSIAWAKTLKPGIGVSLSGKVVTASFADCVYIEEPNRCSGLRINGSFPVAIGDEVSVSGTTSLTDTGEFCISNASVSVTSSGINIRPILINQRNIGYGILSNKIALGPNVTSMLMKVHGRVIGILSDGFYLDDGSLLEAPNGAFGIKVSTCDLAPGSFTPPNVGDYVIATGIVCHYKTGSNVYPYIRCRVPSDLVICR